MTTDTDMAWIDAALMGARPQAIGALLRHFRDLDAAEEAFQDASLRALQHWPKNGPPRDPATWLVFVGRNANALAGRGEIAGLEVPADDGDLDAGHYRDDVLRLLFLCCHDDLPATQQIAVALRVVCGLSVKQIARAFLVSEEVMQQRITRAKARIADTSVPFDVPTPADRAARLEAVASVLYLIFNEGYSASGSTAALRISLCDDAIRLSRSLLRLFPGETELMGLTALMLFQHSRSAARFDDSGEIVLLDDQDRSLWDRKAINEGLALLDKASRHDKPGPYRIQAAIASMHARAARPEDTQWEEIDRLYAILETLVPSPVITLNRVVAVSKVRGPDAALAMLLPLASSLGSYFHFHGVRGGLLMQLGRDAEAKEALDKAISLANSPAEAAHIRMHLDRLVKDAEARGKTALGLASSKAAKGRSKPRTKPGD